MGGLHRASGHAASDAITTSNSGTADPLSVGATMVMSMGFMWLSNSPVDRMLVPRVWMEPRDELDAMGSELDEMSLRSVVAKGGMAISARPRSTGLEYMSSSIE